MQMTARILVLAILPELDRSCWLTKVAPSARAGYRGVWTWARHAINAVTMSSDHPDSILIVDFGSQVTQLIARRVREAGVYSEIAPFQSAADAFTRMKPRGIILSGSPASVLDE